jgi:hypothetical protein
MGIRTAEQAPTHRQNAFQQCETQQSASAAYAVLHCSPSCMLWRPWPHEECIRTHAHGRVQQAAHPQPGGLQHAQQPIRRLQVLGQVTRGDASERERGASTCAVMVRPSLLASLLRTAQHRCFPAVLPWHRKQQCGLKRTCASSHCGWPPTGARSAQPVEADADACVTSSLASQRAGTWRNGLNSGAAGRLLGLVEGATKAPSRSPCSRCAIPILYPHHAQLRGVSSLEVWSLVSGDQLHRPRPGPATSPSSLVPLGPLSAGTHSNLSPWVRARAALRMLGLAPASLTFAMAPPPAGRVRTKTVKKASRVCAPGSRRQHGASMQSVLAVHPSSALCGI